MSIIVRELLKMHTRIDKRDLVEARKCVMTKLQSFYLVEHGTTQFILSYLKTETSPYCDKPNEGIVTFNCITGNKRNDRLTNFLHKIYVNQKAIDLECLCVEYNKVVTNLYIELRCFSTDGNLYEPAIESTNHLLREMEMTMNFYPVCMYYAAMEDIIIRDPSEVEENDKDWSVIIVKKSKTEFIYIEKFGAENDMNDIYQVIDVVG